MVEPLAVPVTVPHSFPRPGDEFSLEMRRISVAEFCIYFGEDPRGWRHAKHQPHTGELGIFVLFHTAQADPECVIRECRQRGGLHTSGFWLLEFTRKFGSNGVDSVAIADPHIIDPKNDHRYPVVGSHGLPRFAWWDGTIPKGRTFVLRLR